MSSQSFNERALVNSLALESLKSVAAVVEVFSLENTVAIIRLACVVGFPEVINVRSDDLGSFRIAVESLLRFVGCSLSVL